jgi:hypothetical protein
VPSYVRSTLNQLVEFPTASLPMIRPAFRSMITAESGSRLRRRADPSDLRRSPRGRPHPLSRIRWLQADQVTLSSVGECGGGRIRGAPALTEGADPIERTRCLPEWTESSASTVISAELDRKAADRCEKVEVHLTSPSLIAELS